MLSGSAILRVVLLLVAAAAITAGVQFAWRGEPGASVEIDPPPSNDVAPRREAPPPEPVPPEPAPRSLPRSASGTSSAASDPTPLAPQPSQAPAPPPPPPSLATGETEVGAAEASAEPKAVALVDLNSAPASDLNRLRGGGTIGRSIISHRPYASVDQLLSKRVLSRATYQRIKDQVTVR